MAIPTPNSSEIECLGVLWKAEEVGAAALKPSQIRELMNRQRSRQKRRPLAVSTVSTVVRLAEAKGLLREVRVDQEGRPVRTKKRGRASKLKRRSPNTAYKALCTPSQIFQQTVRSIVNACPSSSQHALIADLARVLKLPATSYRKLVACLDPISKRRADQR